MYKEDKQFVKLIKLLNGYGFTLQINNKFLWGWVNKNNETISINKILSGSKSFEVNIKKINGSIGMAGNIHYKDLEIFFKENLGSKFEKYYDEFLYTL